MKLFGILLINGTLLLVGCKSVRNTVEPPPEDLMPICIVAEPEQKMVHAINIYSGALWIVDGDTTSIQDYDFHLVNDTLPLAKAFQSVEIPEIIKELHIEGRTYLKTTLSSDSTFSPTTIVRGISPQYKEVQEQIDRILSGFKTVALPKDSATLIFSHMIRLETY